MLFGPDGYLYVSLGDEGWGNDAYGNSQLIDHNFFGAILRLDVDLKPGNLLPNDHPAFRGHYLVPADNPFVNATSFDGNPVDPSRVRTEFYAVGFRNPWRFSFDPQTGDLYCNDTGQVTREEVNLVVPGGQLRLVFSGRQPGWAEVGTGEGRRAVSFPVGGVWPAIG